MKESIGILKDEHRAISAVLLGLNHLADMAQDPKLKPDFQVLRSMLRYIDEYPERLHHPKEEEFLFARLVRRSSEAHKVIAELQREHVLGAQLIRELERQLMFFEESWPQGAADFLAMVHTYADFHWKHMRKEETQLLPLAERHLTPEDWLAVDAAFAGNGDPLVGVEERNFRELFSRIAMTAPTPVGLGDPWKKLSH